MGRRYFDLGGWGGGSLQNNNNNCSETHLLRPLRFQPGGFKTEQDRKLLKAECELRCGCLCLNPHNGRSRATLPECLRVMEDYYGLKTKPRWRNWKELKGAFALGLLCDVLSPWCALRKLQIWRQLLIGGWEMSHDRNAITAFTSSIAYFSWDLNKRANNQMTLRCLLISLPVCMCHVCLPLCVCLFVC